MSKALGSAAATQTCVQNASVIASAGSGDFGLGVAFVFIGTLWPHCKSGHACSRPPASENAVRQATRTMSQKIHLGAQARCAHQRGGVALSCVLRREVRMISESPCSWAAM